jgi:hypothetical protein
MFAAVLFAVAHLLPPAPPPPPQATTPPSPSGQPATVETSPFADNDFPTLLRHLEVRSNDLLEASLSVEDRGAKLTYAPLLFTLVNYRPVLSETRLSISQSNGITTMGIGATYDPASPRSALGERLWAAKAPTSKPAAGYVMALRNAAAALAAELAPKQSEAAAAVQQGDKAARDRLFTEIAALKVRADALRAEADRALAVDTGQEARRIATFYRDLLEASRPVINGSFTTSLFSILGGTRQDTDDDGLADTAHRVKGRALTLSADVPFRRYVPATTATATGHETGPSWRWLQLSAAVTTEWQRGSQEEGTRFGRVFGVGVTGGGIVKILNRDFENTQDYKDSFFISSISVGAAFERRHCTSGDEGLCPDSIETQSALTPFVDVRVTKAAQFRFGVPLKFTRKVGGDSQDDLGLVAVYAIQLGAPK